jgi:hypothetical protein
MAELTVKRFDEPDEVYTYPDGRSTAQIVAVGDDTVVRSSLMPGWSWDEQVKPYTDGWTSCLDTHRELILSGQLRYLMEDGTDLVAGPGSYLDIGAGHRAWVVGSEPCVCVDW